jgi:hypothetical protein
VLGREIIGLRFAFLADEFRLFGALMHVMRDGPHVIEELRVDRPPPILAPHPAPDQGRAAIGHGLLQRESLLVDHAVTEAFVRCPVFVGGRCGRGEPAFVDPAAVEPEGVEVIGMQLQALARL